MPSSAKSSGRSSVTKRTTTNTGGIRRTGTSTASAARSTSAASATSRVNAAIAQAQAAISAHPGLPAQVNQRLQQVQNDVAARLSRVAGTAPSRPTTQPVRKSTRSSSKKRGR